MLGLVKADVVDFYATRGLSLLAYVRFELELM